MSKDDVLFEELMGYVKYFPENYKERVFEILKDLKESSEKDSVISSFLHKIENKKNSKGQLLRDYVHIFERLFFFLSDEKLKEKYSQILLDSYLVRFSENEKVYKKKIEKVQKFLGKELMDLPQFKKKKSFSRLHLGSKKLFTIISSLIANKK